MILTKGKTTLSKFTFTMAIFGIFLITFSIIYEFIYQFFLGGEGINGKDLVPFLLLFTLIYLLNGLTLALSIIGIGKKVIISPKGISKPFVEIFFRKEKIDFIKLNQIKYYHRLMKKGGEFVGIRLITVQNESITYKQRYFSVTINYINVYLSKNKIKYNQDIYI